MFPPPDAVAAVIFTYKVFGHKNSCLVEQRLLSRYMILNGAKIGIISETCKHFGKNLILTVHFSFQSAYSWSEKEGAAHLCATSPRVEK